MPVRLIEGAKRNVRAPSPCTRRRCWLAEVAARGAPDCRALCAGQSDGRRADIGPSSAAASSLERSVAESRHGEASGVDLVATPNLRRTVSRRRRTPGARRRSSAPPP